MEPSPTEPHAYLFAHTRFNDLLDFVTRNSVGGVTEFEQLAEEWRRASARFGELQQLEASWVNRPTVEPLPKSLEPLVREVASDPIFRRAFSVVPGEVGLVELDRLVVSQNTVNLAHVKRLQKKFGQSPEFETLFRACLPVGQSPPPCRVGRLGSDSFAFVSDSNDLRHLDTWLASAEQFPGLVLSGPPAGFVAVAVGYGSNFLNALRLEDRLVLNNGYHRAYALRASGVTHVPCVVQNLNDRRDLALVARAAVRRDPELYFDIARPPVLKDFFDPKLCRVVERVRATRQVRVTVTIEELDVPA